MTLVGELVANRGQPQHSAGGVDGGVGGLFGQASLTGHIADRAMKDQMTYRGFLAELLMTECRRTEKSAQACTDERAQS